MIRVLQNMVHFSTNTARKVGKFWFGVHAIVHPFRSRSFGGVFLVYTSRRRGGAACDVWSSIGYMHTLIVNEPLLISSSSSPASAPNASVLQTEDKARRVLSFPTKAVSDGSDEDEVGDADDPSNSSDSTCKKGAMRYT